MSTDIACIVWVTAVEMRVLMADVVTAVIRLGARVARRLGGALHAGEQLLRRLQHGGP